MSSTDLLLSLFTPAPPPPIIYESDDSDSDSDSPHSHSPYSPHSPYPYPYSRLVDLAEAEADALARSLSSRHPKGWFRERTRRRYQESRSQRFRERLLEILEGKRCGAAVPAAVDAIALWRENRRARGRYCRDDSKTHSYNADAGSAARCREQRDLERAIRESRRYENKLECGLTASEVEQLLTRELSPEDYDLLLRLDEALAPRDAVAPEKARKALGEVTMTVSSPTAAPEGGCRICLEDCFEVGAEISRTKCEHFFHTACLVTWCASHNRCPLCAAPIVKEV